MSNDNIVIVGAGLGAFRVVEQLRRRGHSGKITVLGAEAHLPYDRPPLSKQLLRGEVSSSAFPGIDELDAQWVLGTRAQSLDVTNNLIRTEDGNSYAYDTLVLAPGGRPRTIPQLGSGPGIHVLRTIDDAIALRESLQPEARLIVIGAGFIGCEIAASASQMGAKVALIEALPAPLVRVLGGVAAAKVTALHQDHGVQIFNEAVVAEVLRDEAGQIYAVRLADGSQIEGDTVVVGIGIVPETEWLSGSGVNLADGIICQDTGQTSVANIYALGDAARWWHDLAGEHRRIEHWTTTADQAAIIAANIVQDGNEPPSALSAAPYFWSDQYSMKIQGVGFIDPSTKIDELTIRDRTVLLYSRDGIVEGVVGFSIPGAVMRMKALIERRAPLQEAIALLTP